MVAAAAVLPAAPPEPTLLDAALCAAGEIGDFFRRLTGILGPSIAGNRPMLATALKDAYALPSVLQNVVRRRAPRGTTSHGRRTWSGPCTMGRRETLRTRWLCAKEVPMSTWTGRACTAPFWCAWWWTRSRRPPTAWTPQGGRPCLSASACTSMRPPGSRVSRRGF